MMNTEWYKCSDPDLLLEAVEQTVTREQLVEFVRRCWQRIDRYLPPVETRLTVVDEFAALARQQSNHDAALYASEAALKAARWAPVLRDEQKEQAEILRQIVGPP
jgi:hypothetical protein